MKLLFVYNANSGKLSALLDGLHKMVSPSTYDCNLCAMTFGHFLEDPTWKEFREKSENECMKDDLDKMNWRNNNLEVEKSGLMEQLNALERNLIE